MKTRSLLFKLVSLTLSLSAAAAALAPAPSFARDGHRTNYQSYSSKSFGLGAMLGEPTGLSAKLWKDSRQAIDFGLAYSFNDFFQMYADYLLHFPEILNRSGLSQQQFEPYVGVGPILWVSTESNRHDNKYFTESGASVGLGLRIPFGVEWLAPNAPLGIFAEIVPGVGLIPSTFGFIQGGVGIRYYF